MMNTSLFLINIFKLKQHYLFLCLSIPFLYLLQTIISFTFFYLFIFLNIKCLMKWRSSWSFVINTLMIILRRYLRLIIVIFLWKMRFSTYFHFVLFTFIAVINTIVVTVVVINGYDDGYDDDDGFYYCCINNHFFIFFFFLRPYSLILRILIDELHFFLFSIQFCSLASDVFFLMNKRNPWFLLLTRRERENTNHDTKTQNVKWRRPKLSCCCVRFVHCNHFNRFPESLTQIPSYKPFLSLTLTHS